MKHKTIWLIVTAAVVVLAGGGLLLRNRQRSDSTLPQILRTAQVEQGTIPLTVASSGNVAVDRRLGISFGVPGTVASVDVEVGDRVQQGQTLASLDRAAAEEALQQAQIAVAQAELNLKQLRTPAEASQVQLAELTRQQSAMAMSVAQISEQVAQTQANLDQTRAQDVADLTNDAYEGVVDTLDDYGLPEAYAAPVTVAKMEADGNVGITQLKSEQAIQTAQNSWQSAYESYERSSQTLTDLQEGADEDQVRNLELALALAELNVEQAQGNLDALVLASPIDGIVAAVSIQTGDMVVTGGPVVTILDDSTLYAELSVDEIDIGSIDEGQPVEIILDALPDLVIDGTVESIALLPQTATGVNAYPVRVRLVSPELAAVREGMTASATIIVGTVDNVLVAPTWAIHTDTISGELYTYTVTGATVERAEIGIGASNETWTEIVSGLDAGTTVALITESRGLFGIQGAQIP